ncbi:transport protein particle component [Auricularia subglabra TFB-10046 SS5]|nr:transport protein particle component [Auricularia subglabra TFB-10046 SS5]
MNPSTSTASLLPTLSPLADPAPRLADGTLLDYLLIELVPTLADSSAVATARASKTEAEMRAAGLLAPARKQNAAAASEDADEALRQRLEAVGAHVGANLVERRLARDRARFHDTLDIVKFICKDVWTAVWAKQIDNLRTNHRGVYVLQDNNFRPISRISSHNGPQDALKRAKLYVAWSAGVIRGALARMGLQGTVTPEIHNLPQCTFQIKLPKGAS